MRGHGAKFTRKKEEAVAALLSHKSIEDAARAIDVKPSTLLRWLQVPEFQTAFRKARREAVQQAVARLQQATGAAGVTILKLMTDANVPAAVRLKAAECVFEHAIKGVELEDIGVRSRNWSAPAKKRSAVDSDVAPVAQVKSRQAAQETGSPNH